MRACDERRVLCSMVGLPRPAFCSSPHGTSYACVFSLRVGCCRAPLVVRAQGVQIRGAILVLFFFNVVPGTYRMY